MSSINRKRTLKSDLADLDLIIDKGCGDVEIVNKRANVVRSLQELENLQSLEAAQKSKIKWAIEGDENSKYYHGILNKKRSQLAIRGILVDVCDDVFFNHGQFLKAATLLYCLALIPKKTRDANMVKDFRPISLIGSMYKIIAKILANRLVLVLGDLVNEVQSAFIADRQILDGPFILNEIVQWCQSKKKQSLVFKVDFEKAFDSVRWDYLDDILRRFGFGEKWCSWIQSCLRSSRGSVIVNGSPTEEFQFHKGLKQGDPLSPFLFILVMETLHISFQRIVDAGMFKGIMLSPSLQLSHLFYADDVIFMGQWNESNLDTIVQVLECFHRASGLRLNMSKSKLMGIYVDADKVAQAARKIGCVTLKTPFTYLGSKVGGHMSRIQSWNETIEAMASRLSKWKMKTLSIGGRLTLLKSVLGSMPIYHMSIFKVPMKILQRMESIRSHFFNGSDPLAKKPTWVKWTNVLASKEKGGLGISSLYALNRALMFKWVWRFLSQNSSLWANVIKSIHGDHGKIGKQVKVSYPSIWLDIVKEVDLLKKRGLNLLSFVNKKVGNGSDTLFWEETWHGDVAFKFLFPRAYALESCKNIDVASKLSQNSLAFTFRREPRGGVEQDQFDSLKAMVEGTSLVNIRDRWIWSLQSSGDFTVASIRKLIDEFTLSEVSSSTRWIKAVPIKVNVLAWKIKLDNLPTRLNISRRGMDIDSILCPTCGKAVESTRHIFFTCQIARDILHLITSWWNIPYMEVSSYEECSESPSKAAIFDEVESRSFYWCRYRFELRVSKGTQITMGKSLGLHYFVGMMQGMGSWMVIGPLEECRFKSLPNQVVLAQGSDRWTWTANGSGQFSVASVRKIIDNKLCSGGENSTRWIRCVPNKINIHAWKVMTESLATRFDISRRGIVIDSILCGNCDIGVETTSHLFFTCDMATSVRRLINRWWEVPDMEIDSYATWKGWIVTIRMASKTKLMFEGVYYVMWWLLWWYRNKKIFEGKSLIKVMFLDDVISKSFYWCRARCKAYFSWTDWLKNPYLISL
ncbi:RNA-directed DNA polymerase, eukaryota, reverse transcriptase zinc-binding domain protein [Tanacetum coccineum]|uniref:RNA-directed DNA polymerase, eukaryota, reverse transcriptase zinc-binding domain protein n=1 Tax=Tanacetum coccineum TaxID=301880 RepID=A0ABQ5GX85_9ASTR